MHITLGISVFLTHLFVVTRTHPQILNGTGGLKPQLRSIDYSGKDNHIYIPPHISQNTGTGNKNESIFGSGGGSGGNGSVAGAPGLVEDDEVADINSLTDDLEDWEAPLFFRQNYPYYLAGYDDEYRPIWVAEMGKYDARPLFEDKGARIPTLEQYAKQGVYRVLKSIREQCTAERNVTEAFYLVDLDGLSFWHLTHTPSIVLGNKIGRRYNNILEKHFGGAIIINANYLATILINTVKPVYGRQMEKIEVYGTQQAKWMPALRRIFPPESIPTWYGGSPNFKPIRVYG